MKRMVWTNRDRVVVAGIALLFSALNLFHVFYWALAVPENTIFIGITHWYEDYFFYLSQLTQGALGRWQLVNAYTLEPIPLGYNWIFNLLLGKIAGLLSIPPWRFYDGSIFVLSLGYILLAYRTLQEVFGSEKRYRTAALLIALASTHWVMFQKTAAGVVPQAVTYFYAYTAAWNRLGGVAHHIAQNILSLYAVLLFSRILAVLVKKDQGPLRNISATLLLLSVTITSLFVISAFFAAMDLVVFTVVLIYYVFAVKAIRLNKTIIVSAATVVLPVVLLAVYQQSILAHPFWAAVRLWEQTRFGATAGTFLLSSGAIVLLLPFGIPAFLKKATPIRVVGFVYAFGPIFVSFSPLPQIMNIPSFRIFQPPAYVFFGAIAAVAIHVLTRRLRRWQRQAYLVVLTVFLAMQIPGLVLEIRSRVNEYYLNSHLNFLDANVYDGLVYLKGQPHDKGALAVHTLESFVPVVSGHSVYEGHATLTVDYKTKIDATLAFYSRSMTPNDAYDFLSKNNIGYVLWEKRFGDPVFLPSYPFLQTLYDNPSLVIYRVGITP